MKESEPACNFFARATFELSSLPFVKDVVTGIVDLIVKFFSTKKTIGDQRSVDSTVKNLSYWLTFV
jgi:hypothetical protein